MGATMNPLDERSAQECALALDLPKDRELDFLIVEDAALVAAARQVHSPASITVIMSNQQNAQTLRQTEPGVIEGNFWHIGGRWITQRATFNAILLNLPENYVDTFTLAYRLLRPGGCLVGVAPLAVTTDKNRQARELREHILRVGLIRPLPVGKWALVKMTKPPYVSSQEYGARVIDGYTLPSLFNQTGEI